MYVNRLDLHVDLNHCIAVCQISTSVMNYLKLYASFYSGCHLLQWACTHINNIFADACSAKHIHSTALVRSRSLWTAHRKVSRIVCTYCSQSAHTLRTAHSTYQSVSASIQACASKVILLPALSCDSGGTHTERRVSPYYIREVTLCCARAQPELRQTKCTG